MGFIKRLRLNAENTLSRALLASKIPEKEFFPKRIIVKMLKGTPEEQLAAARQLQVRNYSLSKLNLRQRDLLDICKHSLRGLGVIRRIRHAPKDWISIYLHKIFGGSPTQNWRLLLNDGYEHALQILIESDSIFDSNRSYWLQLQDSFNDIVTRKFIEFLNCRSTDFGPQKLKDNNGQLVKFGRLIQKNSHLDKFHPNICLNFRAIHDRRNKLPGSHPYSERGGTQNKWLFKYERNILINTEKNALYEVIDFYSNNK